MPASDRVLVDSSAWIDYFAGVDRVVEVLDRPISDDRVVVCGTVMQEVLQGARDEKMLARLDHGLSTWPSEPETPADFVEAGRMYARLRWKGITVPPPDCLIAAVARRCGYLVCATDPHFEKIPGLQRFSI